MYSDIEEADPLFGPYYISCSGNQVSKFQMNTSLNGLNAIIIAFRIQPSAPPGMDQLILSVKSASVQPFDYQITYSAMKKNLAFMNKMGNTASTLTDTILPGIR